MTDLDRVKEMQSEYKPSKIAVLWYKIFGRGNNARGRTFVWWLSIIMFFVPFVVGTAWSALFCVPIVIFLLIHILLVRPLEYYRHKKIRELLG